MNKEINLPPFYVGQRVVALETKRNAFWGTELTKDAIYTVEDLHKCGCGTWYLDVGIRANGIGIVACGDCNKRRERSDIQYARAKLFAPIEENFQSISLEKILEKETKLISIN